MFATSRQRVGKVSKITCQKESHSSFSGLQTRSAAGYPKPIITRSRELRDPERDHAWNLDLTELHVRQF